MKKKITILCLSVLPFLLNAQNIPNRDFENWEVKSLAENLEEWQTTLSELNLALLNVDNVEKSTDAQHGDFSLRLSNSIINNDSVFGYALLGSVGDEGPNGGISYTSDIDSITGYYKCNMVSGDTATVLIIQYNATDTVYNFYGIGGVENNWTRFAIPVDAQNGTNDEVFVGFVSTNPDLPGGPDATFHPDSWIMFDNIAFTHSSSTPAILPNHSFENWDAITYEDPQGWFTLNLYSTLFGAEVSVEKTTDAYSGDYAMKITSKYQPVFDDTIGIALNSEIGDILPGGFAFNEVPTTISGYYKYSPIVSTDTAMFALFLTRYDTVNDSTITVYQQFFQLENQANYTSFSFDIDTTGLANSGFDSANIILLSSQYAFSGGVPAGSELYIDELWLDSKCAYADTTSLFGADTIYLEMTNFSLEYFELPNDYIYYSWSNGDTTNILNTLTDGTYSVSVVDMNNCEISDTSYFDFEILTLIESPITNLISIFPNPTSSIINIDLTQTKQSLEKEITVFDLVGKQIIHTFVQEQNVKIDMRKLPQGIYYLDIRIGEELTAYKVVKK